MVHGDASGFKATGGIPVGTSSDFVYLRCIVIFPFECPVSARRRNVSRVNGRLWKPPNLRPGKDDPSFFRGVAQAVRPNGQRKPQDRFFSLIQLRP
jgi:hypothetical protein